MAAFPELPVESVVTDGAVSQVLGLSVSISTFLSLSSTPRMLPPPCPPHAHHSHLTVHPCCSAFFYFQVRSRNSHGISPALVNPCCSRDRRRGVSPRQASQRRPGLRDRKQVQAAPRQRPRRAICKPDIVSSFFSWCRSTRGRWSTRGTRRACGLPAVLPWPTTRMKPSASTRHGTSSQCWARRRTASACD